MSVTATIVIEDETIIAQVSAAARGPAGEPGAAGATGPAGPNTVTTATTTNLTGFISGDGTNIAGATAAATTATANTLVLRSAGGGASFAGLNTNSGSYAQIGGATFNVATTSNANLTTTGSGTVIVSGAGGTTISGGTLTFSPSGFTYGAGAASAHRTALGLGATGSITASDPLTLTQTWTNAAVTYTGLQVNVTDSGSNAASLLMDLRVGGVSRLSVNKIGLIALPPVGGDGTGVVFGGSSITNARSYLGQYGLRLTQNLGVRWSESTNLNVLDLSLERDAANTLAQRNGTAQQESRIYGTYTGAGNYRRLALKMSSAGVAQIVAEGGGSGASGNRIEIDGLRIGKGGSDVATNTALGASALNANTTGFNNSAVGFEALRNNTTGSNNSAVGLQALLNNATGGSNTAVGFIALRNNTSGSQNSAVGREALRLNTTGGNNSAVGYASLLNNTTGANNTAVGVSAIRNNTTGSSNAAVGSNALLFNSTGSNNSALGHEALLNNTTGSNNSAVGREALFGNTTGGSNSAIGFRAGRYIADGTTANAITASSVYLGAETKAFANNQTNQIVIGYNAIGLGSNTAVLGNDSIETTALKGDVGIGTTSPASKLTVTGGDIEVTDSASGIILKSPDGTRYRVTVSDLGILSAASLP